MDKMYKFLRTLKPAIQKRIKKAMVLIRRNELVDLDVKSLKGKPNYYRCRVGNIRIIFVNTTKNSNTIVYIQFRGQAYKNL
jgi:mRNA-degrading endonuclease RelE of RelBE toxin-antitoxin system